MAPGPVPFRRGSAVGAFGRHYLPDLVYGANDGIITTFAVVSGVTGASLSPRILLILGFANLLADGFSMGASNYLSRRSRVLVTRQRWWRSGVEMLLVGAAAATVAYGVGALLARLTAG